MDSTLLTTVYTILGIILALGAMVYSWAKYKTAKDTNLDEAANAAMKNLQITVGALQTQNALQAGQISVGDVERKKLADKVIELSGKVDTLSTIPLDKIEQHMADTNEILRAILPLIPKSTTEHTITETTTVKK